jgi:hypothetical protein
MPSGELQPLFEDMPDDNIMFALPDMEVRIIMGIIIP